MNNIAIIGGGLSGTSLAYYLSARGFQVTLIESGSIGACGATGVSRGIVRVYDPQPPIMRSALKGVREWLYWQKSHPGIFNNCGCLYLLKEGNVQEAKQAIENVKDDNYPINLINGSEEIKQLVPLLNNSELDTNQWAIWEPYGGYINTRLASQVIMQEARNLGATAMEHLTVDAIIKTNNGVEISVNSTSLKVDYAIIATGARLSELHSNDKVFCRSIPLTSLHHESDFPLKNCIIDEQSKSYIRPESGQFVFAGGAEQQDAQSLSELPTETNVIYRDNQNLARKLTNDPSFNMVAGIPGYDAYTETFEPVLENVSEEKNIGVFCGFSGRGAKYIPFAAKNYAQELASFFTESFSKSLHTDNCKFSVNESSSRVCDKDEGFVHG